MHCMMWSHDKQIGDRADSSRTMWRTGGDSDDDMRDLRAMGARRRRFKGCARCRMVGACQRNVALEFQASVTIECVT